MNVAGILLAAGAGTRFRAAGGGSKLLAPVDGRPLIERPLEALRGAGLGELVVVLGSGAAEISAGADLSGARVLVHPGWADGMASSLAAALATLRTTARPRSSCSGMARVSSARPCAGCVSGSPSATRRWSVLATRVDLRIRSRSCARLWARLPQTGEDGARALGVRRVDVDCSDLSAPGDADTPAEL